MVEHLIVRNQQGGGEEAREIGEGGRLRVVHRGVNLMDTLQS
jgi:hypothetical protein